MLHIFIYFFSKEIGNYSILLFGTHNVSGCILLTFKQMTYKHKLETTKHTHTTVNEWKKKSKMKINKIKYKTFLLLFLFLTFVIFSVLLPITNM